MRRTVTIGSILLAAAVVVGAAAWVVWTTSEDPAPAPPAARNNSTHEEPWCPAVEVIAAPGTWETTATDNPLNPTANPHSLLLPVTRQLQATYSSVQARVWTLPYPAQFRSVNSPDQLGYDESRDAGFQRLAAELRFIQDSCARTQFVLLGFSQGAAIVGDMASEIGNGRGVIPADKVAAVALVSDPRRVPGEGLTPGVVVDGLGVEVALQSFNDAAQFLVPGATLRGPRDGGFGQLGDRTYQLCAPGDYVCDMPESSASGIDQLFRIIENNQVHGQYSFSRQVFGDKTTLDWLAVWTRDQVDRINEQR